MRIEIADYKVVMKGYHYTKFQRIVEEFLNMNTPCAKLKLDNGEYKTPTAAASAVRNYIKRNRCDNLTVKVVNNEVYIFNTLLVEGI